MPRSRSNRSVSPQKPLTSESTKVLADRDEIFQNVQEIFGNSMDAEVIRMVLIECNWKGEEAIDKLLTIAESMEAQAQNQSQLRQIAEGVFGPLNSGDYHNPDRRRGYQHPPLPVSQLSPSNKVIRRPVKSTSAEDGQSADHNIGDRPGLDLYTSRGPKSSSSLLHSSASLMPVKGHVEELDLHFPRLPSQGPSTNHSSASSCSPKSYSPQHMGNIETDNKTGSKSQLILQAQSAYNQQYDDAASAQRWEEYKQEFSNHYIESKVSSRFEGNKEKSSAEKAPVGSQTQQKNETSRNFPVRLLSQSPDDDVGETNSEKVEYGRIDSVEMDETVLKVISEVHDDFSYTKRARSADTNCDRQRSSSLSLAGSPDPESERAVTPDCSNRTTPISVVQPMTLPVIGLSAEAAEFVPRVKKDTEKKEKEETFKKEKEEKTVKQNVTKSKLIPVVSKPATTEIQSGIRINSPTVPRSSSHPGSPALSPGLSSPSSNLSSPSSLTGSPMFITPKWAPIYRSIHTPPPPLQSTIITTGPRFMAPPPPPRVNLTPQTYHLPPSVPIPLTNRMVFGAPPPIFRVASMPASVSALRPPHSQLPTKTEDRVAMTTGQPIMATSEAKKMSKPPSAAMKIVNHSSIAVNLQKIRDLQQSGKKVLVIMRGLPGSGKSFLSRALQLDGVVLSTDDYFTHGNKYDYNPDKLTEAHQWNRERTKESMRMGTNPIIIDNTNTQRWEFKSYVSMAQNHGYHVEIMEPDTPWKYNPSELARHTVHGVPKENIQRMLSRYEHNITVEMLLKPKPGGQSSRTCDAVIESSSEVESKPLVNEPSSADAMTCGARQSLSLVTDSAAQDLWDRSPAALWSPSSTPSRNSSKDRTSSSQGSPISSQHSRSGSPFVPSNMEEVRDPVRSLSRSSVARWSQSVPLPSDQAQSRRVHRRTQSGKQHKEKVKAVEAKLSDEILSLVRDTLNDQVGDKNLSDADLHKIEEEIKALLQLYPMNEAEIEAAEELISLSLKVSSVEEEEVLDLNEHGADEARAIPNKHEEDDIEEEFFYETLPPENDIKVDLRDQKQDDLEDNDNCIHKINVKNESDPKQENSVPENQNNESDVFETKASDISSSKEILKSGLLALNTPCSTEIKYWGLDSISETGSVESVAKVPTLWTDSDEKSDNWEDASSETDWMKRDETNTQETVVKEQRKKLSRQNHDRKTIAQFPDKSNDINSVSDESYDVKKMYMNGGSEKVGTELDRQTDENKVNGDNCDLTLDELEKIKTITPKEIDFFESAYLPGEIVEVNKNELEEKSDTVNTFSEIPKIDIISTPVKDDEVLGEVNDSLQLLQASYSETEDLSSVANCVSSKSNAVSNTDSLAKPSDVAVLDKTNVIADENTVVNSLKNAQSEGNNESVDIVTEKKRDVSNDTSELTKENKKKRPSKRKIAANFIAPLFNEEDKERFLAKDWLSLPVDWSSSGVQTPLDTSKPCLVDSASMTESQDFAAVLTLSQGGFVDHDIKYLTGKPCKLIRTDNNDTELHGKNMLGDIAKIYTIDKSTSTADLEQVSKCESIEFLKTCFPDVPDDELECVLTNCEDNVEWAIEMLIEWEDSVSLSEDEKKEFIEEIAKVRKCPSPVMQSSCVRLGENNLKSLLDLCFSFIEVQNIATRGEVEIQMIQTGKERLDRIEDDNISKIRLHRSVSMSESQAEDSLEQYNKSVITEALLNFDSDPSETSGLNMIISEKNERSVEASEAVITHKMGESLDVSEQLNDEQLKVSENQNDEDLINIGFGKVLKEIHRKKTQVASTPKKEIHKMNGQEQDYSISPDRDDIWESAIADGGLDKLVEPRAVQLMLAEDVVSQLENMYGPVGLHYTGGPGGIPVQLDKKACWVLYQCLKQSVSHHNYTTQQLRKDEELARRLQMEEDMKKNAVPYASTQQAPIHRVQSLAEIMKEEEKKQADQQHFQSMVRAEGGHMALATRMKRRTLHEKFPNIDKAVLDDFFQENCFNLTETEQYIQQILDVQPSSTQVMNSEAAEERDMLLEQAKTQSLHDIMDGYLHTEARTSKFQDSSFPQYEDYRGEAEVHRRLRHECFQKAQEAHSRGLKQVASFYSQQGHQHTQKIKEANMRASERILSERQGDLDRNMVLDLHGLHVDEAVAAIDNILPQKERERTRSHLTIITGRGSHSRGGVPKLRPTVLAYLQRHSYQFTEAQIGVFRVSLKYRSPV